MTLISINRLVLKGVQRHFNCPENNFLKTHYTIMDLRVFI